MTGSTANIPLDHSADAGVEPYRPAEIELKWQRLWSDAGLFATPDHDPTKQDAYVRVAPPFTTGDVHMGHVRSYSIGDVSARFRRARGEAVLFGLGFDAFGLPVELGAIEHDMPPSEWVSRCQRRMQGQLGRLGLSFDWSRTSLACEPDAYRWSQWLFLKFLEADLVFRRDGYVDWCERCRTVLAATQVEDGRCWRCHGETRVERREQWYLRLSAYNEENERRLSDLTDWNEASLAAQRSFLGRTDGVEFDAQTLDGEDLVVFTPFPDAIAEARFIAVSPRAEDAGRWLEGSDDESALAAGSELVMTPHVAYVPGVSHSLPIVVSTAVDDRYGPTTVLGIPAVDRTDAEIAANLHGREDALWQVKRKPLPKRPAARYKAADFAISRQRAWGTPIPIVHCEACGAVPVPITDLPVHLPADLRITGEGNALVEHPTFSSCPCPACGADARRETDTLDCHLDAAWHTLSLTVPREARAQGLVDHREVQRWLPASVTVHGADIGGFVLVQRMALKALRDLGTLDFLTAGEPYVAGQMHQMVLLEGRKMSKHLGNTVSPAELVEAVGADSLRLAVLHAAAPERAFSWDEGVLRHCNRFLARLWRYALPRLVERPAPPREVPIEMSTGRRRRLADWCRTATARVTENYESLELHKATRNIMKLLDAIEAFERRVLQSRGDLTESDRDAIALALVTLLQLTAPVTPHIAEELWHRAGRDGFVCQEPWPC